ncbi:MAG: IS1595 family transposase [Beijerinckiaceae bacterium]|nr:MAG: IS1595 family transposase [Beijerinckiaceae bacterium]
MASVFSEAYFQDEAAAFERLETIVWPNGPVCPHCGCTGRIRPLTGVKDKKGRVRLGLRKCYDCKGQFTVRKGTVFEDSPIPLHIWFQAAFLMCSSKKGVSSNQLHRTLGVTLKTAWFMSHRLREAMRSGDLSPLGGEGKTVEADETYIGRLVDVPKQRHGYAHKNVVLTLVERGGAARSWHVDTTTVGTLIPIIRANVAHETAMMTDQASWYKNLNKDGDFASHDSVDHSKDEYIRRDGDRMIGTNTVEGYYSIFKRGMKGIYQHCSERHLHRYLAEFDFRYSNRVRLGVNDTERATRALRGIVGRRLTYRDSSAPAK